MKFNFNIINLFLPVLISLISVRGENNETIENYTVHSNVVVETFTETTKTSIPTITNTTTTSINNIDLLPHEKTNNSINNILNNPPQHHYSESIQICPTTDKDNCNDPCDTGFLRYETITNKNITDKYLNNTDFSFVITYCAVHEYYDNDKMECVEDENFLRFFKLACSVYGYIYDPNLSACIKSIPYNENEGCFEDNRCGRPWIEESDDHESKTCHLKIRTKPTLIDIMPYKRKYFGIYHPFCIDECLVDRFDMYGNGNSFQYINNYFDECYCTISEPAPLCNEECSQSFTYSELHRYLVDYDDPSARFSIQFNDKRDNIEWCICPSPADLKYIVKAEKPECCTGDECLNSPLLKCCSDSKVFIHKNNIYYGFENEERCIWPADKKIPEIAKVSPKNDPRSTSWDLGPFHKVLPTSYTPKVLPTSSSIPKSITNTNTNTITYAKSFPKYTTSEATSIASTTDINTYPATLSEYLTTLMTIPSKKKVVKITKKVTSKITKKITVKVTRKKDSPQ